MKAVANITRHGGSMEIKARLRFKVVTGSNCNGTWLWAEMRRGVNQKSLL